MITVLSPEPLYSVYTGYKGEHDFKASLAFQGEGFLKQVENRSQILGSAREPVPVPPICRDTRNLEISMQSGLPLGVLYDSYKGYSKLDIDTTPLYWKLSFRERSHRPETLCQLAARCTREMWQGACC